ncbi:restriction endonuclease subunit S [Prevotella jejuni]
MKKYDEYKDSGFDWIGKIPAQWDNLRLRFVCELRNGYTPSKDNSDYWEDGTIPWYRMEDIRDTGRKLQEAKQYITEEAVKGGGLFDAGSFILATTATIGEHALLIVDSLANQQFTNLKIRKSLSNILSRDYFFYYLFVIDDYCKATTKTSTFPAVSMELLKNCHIVFPSFCEQTTIAAYLDTHCAKIDNLISIQQKRIALLQELKQSVITHAVTKGLNPNVEMKQSGVEWIGDVPKHWEVCKLKSYCSLKGRIGWNGLRSEEFEKESYAYLVTGQDFVSSDIEWGKCYQINKIRYDEDPCIQLENGDLLITKDGTIGKIAKVSNMDKPACLNSGIFVLKQKSHNQFEQGYLYWALFSNLLKDFNSYTSTGTTILHLYQNIFENMPLVVPSKKEQQEISNYLDSKTMRIDTSISNAQHQIELLQEYKQSLITEVVTGKRKVTDN